MKKTVMSYLSGRKVRKAFTTTMKNGKTRFEAKKHEAYCREKLAILK